MTQENQHGHVHHDSGQADPQEAPRWDAEFWDERYGSAPALWSGNPNQRLV